MDLIDIYRTFHPKVAKHTFYENAYESCSKTDYMVRHKTSLNKFKRTEIISNFSYHNGLKLETNIKKKTEKNSNTWRLNNEWVTTEIKKEIKKYLETNENEPTTNQNLWGTEKAGLRGKFIVI